MKADCHMHMVLDGVDWKSSIACGVDDGFIRNTLQIYKELGYAYLRVGGDRFDVSARARELAPEYDIQYRNPSPLFPRKAATAALLTQHGMTYSTMLNL